MKDFDTDFSNSNSIDTWRGILLGAEIFSAAF